METFYFILALIGFALFLCFGCRDDYRRDPKDFAKTIFGVLMGTFSLSIGLFGPVGLIKSVDGAYRRITQKLNLPLFNRLFSGI